ncbi:MAG: CoA transferase [Nitrospinota bacterium]|nr:CoA transferase [Nitrospinota bacterium]
MSAPLKDIKILDLTRILAGPYCTMMLGDMGAEIIKVENPKNGDDTRGWGPPFLNGVSTYFISVNRNKKSITLNLKHVEGKKILNKLIKECDVLVENFRPGTLERLGFPWTEIQKINEKIIFASVSGFGQTGPRKNEPGFDVVIQGEGGIMSITGEPDGPPTKVGASIGDITAGMLAAQGILLALYNREKTGKGQMVDISMLDGQISLLTYHANAFFATGKIPNRRGNRHPSITPYETYKCRNGFFNLGVGNDSLWIKFCDSLELDELKEDKRFQINADRVKNRTELEEILIPFFENFELEKIINILRDAGIPCGAINNLENALNNPQVVAREMTQEIEIPEVGKTKITGIPIKMSETPGSIRIPPPGLGEHTTQILKNYLYFSDIEIKNLREKNVI